jgi:N-methylhydantoinase A
MLERLGIEAAAILFLNCYASPDHGARQGHPGEEPPRDVRLCLARASQEYREFERCSTVVANAYIGPIVRSYIGEIEDHIRAEQLAALS